MKKKVGPSREIIIPERKYCDPEFCEDCCYVGSGDFICNKYTDENSHHFFVIDDWTPTEYFGICNELKQNVTMIRRTKNPEDI